MKTILLPPAGRVLQAVLFFLVAFSPVFGQVGSFTQTSSNSFVFKIAGFPPLPRNGVTTKDPDYEIYVHFGDGNVQRITPQRAGNDGTNYSFQDLNIPYTYQQNGTYRPTFSLTAKYTPPSPPKREFFPPVPPITTATGSTGTFVQSPPILVGRSIGMDTSHRVPYAKDEQATFAIAWARNPVPPGSKVVVFYGGLRDNSGRLDAASLVMANLKSIMTINAGDPSFPNQAGPAQRIWVTSSSATSTSVYSVLTNKYDSSFVIPSLISGSAAIPEGRFFLNFRNDQDLIFTNKKVSVFGVILTESPLRTVDSLSKLGDIKDLFNLDLQPDPDNNAFRIGDGYVYDWFLYEERPVYVHDPNELVITKMTQNPQGDYDLLLDYTSCSHEKSNVPTPGATVIFDKTELVPTSLEIIGADYGPNALIIGPATIPAGYFFAKRIANIVLNPGECFTMHFKGVLPAAKVGLAHVDGQVLHGCVELDNETNADPVDVCRWNTKFPEPNGPSTDKGPCGKPGFCNQIQCLCASSPLPCWLLVLLALLLLIWLFFKKKN